MRRPYGVLLTSLKIVKQKMNSRDNKILNGLSISVGVIPENKITPKWLNSRQFCQNTLSLIDPQYWSIEQVTLGITA